MRAKGEEIVESEDSLKLTEQTDLTDWIKVTLGQKAAKVKTTSKLESHPCVVTVEEMAAARHFIKTQGTNFSEEQRFTILPATTRIAMCLRQRYPTTTTTLKSSSTSP